MNRDEIYKKDKARLIGVFVGMLLCVGVIVFIEGRKPVTPEAQLRSHFERFMHTCDSTAMHWESEQRASVQGLTILCRAKHSPSGSH